MTRFWYSGLAVILLLILFTQRDFDNRYNRPIIGDAKGYYAYLPALLIYHDLSYDFVDEMEVKYYAEDGSLAKDFKMKQPNGTFVNKCFPGTAIFYLPFFLIAYFFSVVFGLPLDGYSILFQWSIVFAHFSFYFLGIYYLDRFLKMRSIQPSARIISIIGLTLVSNTYFYLIYDHSIAHVFGFFGCTYLLYNTQKWGETKDLRFFGRILILLSLMVITRPTNALMLILIPLIYSPKLMLQDLKTHFNWSNIPWKAIVLSCITLAIAPLLWKLQSGNWFVYSYGEEGFNFFKPNLLNFLFSYKKGWLLWSPGLILFIVTGLVYFYRIIKWKGIYFFSILLLTTYIFSSWWIWTFGMGMGQRTMIDYYPILIWAFAGFLSVYNWKKTLTIVLIPFVMINILQAHQIHRFILIGGETTKESYWQHFLQLKTDAPIINIESNWEELGRQEIEQTIQLDAENHYSYSIEIPSAHKDAFFVVKATIGGLNGKSKAAIVLSDEEGKWYTSQFPSSDIYRTPREVQYLFVPNQEITSPIKCYIWNGDSEDIVKIERLEVITYKVKSK
jgi:hypothetical protein